MENETAITDTDDRNGQTCAKCGAGYYTETSFHDDLDGVLHCNNKKCNHEVKRYRYKDNPEPVIEKAKLSPAAHAVLDAYTDAPMSGRTALAAALRAAADQASYCLDGSDYCVMAKDDILAMAAELEGAN